MLIRYILLLGALSCAVPDVAGSEEPFSLVAEGVRKWRRGNLHTHSHWSDGDDYLESIALWYRNHDYDFLVYTDHNILADRERWVTVDETKGGRKAYEKLKANFPDWVEQRSSDGRLQVRLRRFDEVADRFHAPGEFLLVQGEEISDRFGQAPIHLNVSNIRDLIEPQSGSDVFDTIQNNVTAAIQQRRATGQPMLVHVNHPNFGYAVAAEDLMRVQGENFFEVYNGHPSVNNSGDQTRPGTERIWDIILAHRLAVFDLPIMYGLAVDDAHDYHDIPSRGSEPGRGWVMALTDQLSAEALIEALEKGRFYASSGVELRRVEYDGRTLEVEVAPKSGETYKIEFVGARASVDLEKRPFVADDGRPDSAVLRYSEQVGAVFKTVGGTLGKYRFSGDELYVRARITSSAAHPNPSEPEDAQTAWVQPIVGPGARPAE